MVDLDDGRCAPQSHFSFESHHKMLGENKVYISKHFKTQLQPHTSGDWLRKRILDDKHRTWYGRNKGTVSTTASSSKKPAKATRKIFRHNPRSPEKSHWELQHCGLRLSSLSYGPRERPFRRFSDPFTWPHLRNETGASLRLLNYLSPFYGHFKLKVYTYRFPDS